MGFKFKWWKPTEYKMIQLETGTIQYVLDTAIEKRLKDGWVLYTESGRDAPDYYVPDVFQFFGKMSYGKLPGIKVLLWLFRIHKSYKEDLNFLDIPWGIMTLGKLPTISFLAQVWKGWYEDATNVARFITVFVAGLVISSPFVTLVGWVFVQYVTGRW